MLPLLGSLYLVHYLEQPLWKFFPSVSPVYF